MVAVTNRETLRSRVNYKRRAGEKAAGPYLTAAEWEAIKARYGYRCAYSPKRESALAKLTMDHVIPVAKWGTHTIDNIVPACRECNSRKGAKIIAQFRKQSSHLTLNRCRDDDEKGPRSEVRRRITPEVRAREGRMFGTRQPLDGPIFETLADAHSRPFAFEHLLKRETARWKLV